MDIKDISIHAIEELLHQETNPTKEFLEAMSRDSRAGVKKLLVKYYRAQEEISKKRDKAQRMLLEEGKLWSQGYTLIGGIDEAGRGPLAGPVVAACVILPKGLIIEGVDDSKKLSPAKREEMFAIIMQQAESVGVGCVDHHRIDEINILNATKEAMLKAVAACSKGPEYLLIDAVSLKCNIPQLPIISGDTQSQTIAAASIIAKVTRDRAMVKFDAQYPGYGFEKHKGYGTEEHMEAIKRLGLSPIHRMSFTTQLR